MPILFFLDAEYRQSKSDADCAAANRAAASIRFGQEWRGNPGTASKKPAHELFPILLWRYHRLVE